MKCDWQLTFPVFYPLFSAELSETLLSLFLLNCSYALHSGTVEFAAGQAEARRGRV